MQARNSRKVIKTEIRNIVFCSAAPITEKSYSAALLKKLYITFKMLPYKMDDLDEMDTEIPWEMGLVFELGITVDKKNIPYKFF